MTVSTKKLSEPNHRTKVGNQRRAKMRQHLLLSALELFMRNSDSELLIDDVISNAKVSRGTFYNYFNTTHELAIALVSEMSDEVLKIIDPYVLDFDDPLQRMCMGLRLYINVTRKYKVWGSLLTKMGPYHTVRNRQIDIYVTRDLRQAMQLKIIPEDDVIVLRDIVLGAVYYAIETIQNEEIESHHSNKIMQKVLYMAGLSQERATEFAFNPLIKIDKIDTMESHYFAYLREKLSF